MHATRKSGYPSRQTLYQWLNEWVAYFATVFRLTWSTRAISDLERPAASIDRILFTVSWGTVISSILPGRARQSNRPGKPYGEGRAPGPRGAALLLKLLNFSCSRCLFPSDHSDHFLVNINIRLRRHRRGPHRGRAAQPAVRLRPDQGRRRRRRGRVPAPLHHAQLLGHRRGAQLRQDDEGALRPRRRPRGRARAGHRGDA